MSAKHTEGELHAPGMCEIHDEQHRIVADTNPIMNNGVHHSFADGEGEANAARLVKCWNMHDELVEALERLANAASDPWVANNTSVMDGPIEAARAILSKSRSEP